MVVSCKQIDQRLELTHKDVAMVCAPLFQRMKKTIQQVLLDGKIRGRSIGRIILAGGACRMSIVQQYLQHVLKRKDIEILEPDYIIALGCGICAGMKEKDVQLSDIALTDISVFSLNE